MNEIVFSCTTLKGTGKNGVLPRDPDGYVTMPIGALNTFNSNGQYYPYEEAKKLFVNSSALMRRINTGCLKGELGHPKQLPNQTDASFIQRVMSVEEKSVCAHFSKVWLDFNSVKDAKGSPVITIMAKVKGSGAYGQALDTSLDNPKEEVCFSIRAFTNDTRVRGVVQRELVEIITWDNVTEPGISVAKKYFSPVLESFVDTKFSKQDILTAITPNSQAGYIAMESAIITGQNLLKFMNAGTIQRPSFMDW